MKYCSQISNICTKANWSFRFLRRNTYLSTRDKRGSIQRTGAYSPGMQQFCVGPSGVGLQDELEKVQNRAAKFVTGNYNYETGNMTGILEYLKWEYLKKRRRDSRLMLFVACWDTQTVG